MPKIDSNSLKNPSRILDTLKGKLTSAGSLKPGAGTQIYGEIDEHLKTGAYIK